jgi:hypothetical protein
VRGVGSLSSNLLSGLIGALLVLAFQEIRKCLSEKQQRKNLCLFFIHDLVSIKSLLEQERHKMNIEFISTLVSRTFWQKLSPDMLRLLKPKIVQKIILCYTFIEFTFQVLLRGEQVKELVGKLDDSEFEGLLNTIVERVDEVVKELIEYGGFEELDEIIKPS